MRIRLVLLILIAFGAALGTVWFARNWMEAQRAAMTQAPPAPLSHDEILVAKEALPAGTLLKPEQLRWQAWPEGSVVSAYIAKGKRTPEDFAGAVIREGLREGQPLTDTMVVKPGDSGFLAAVLAPGMRAVSVSINATTGISGFVFPGDRVDVILTHNIQKPGEEQQIVRHASETVLSNVRVIAVDQSVNDQEDKPAVAKNVTLEATPKQAEILTLVSELGKLSLSLRSIVRDESTPGNEKEDGKEKPTLIAERPRTYTWDSDASVLLSPPHADGQTVNVLHGEKAETHDFGSGK
ncbi:MAG TPA: Flp pilus assembly protein CpaB [Alphaproteobacteria bacterium]|jgi:pilus assembly protein CpaB|nr:Flp pilus assembly protein CpaB [Alphaproteobacteria bacterium]